MNQQQFENVIPIRAGLRRPRVRRLSVFLRLVLAVMATTILALTCLVFVLGKDLRRVEQKVDRLTPAAELRRLP